VEVRASPDDRDPLLLVDVEMSPFSVPELSFVQITDPSSERFAIDRDRDGQDTLFGTIARNLEEEERALRAGLAPGQVRRGLRLLGGVLDAMQDFCRLLGKEVFLVEPLFYHSALGYERHGCGYLLGRELMEEIHREFDPGGRLHAALDGSSAFRQRGFDRTVRGRSWAIHDGILAALAGTRWSGVKMYRLASRPAAVSTFPAATYCRAGRAATDRMAAKRPRPAAPRKPMPRKPPKIEVPPTVYRRRPKHRRRTEDERP
jgi:hypothetical protein